MTIINFAAKTLLIHSTLGHQQKVHQCVANSSHDYFINIYFYKCPNTSKADASDFIIFYNSLLKF